MNESDTARPGPLTALRQLATTLLAILRNRLELFVVELQEERIRLFNALLLAATVVVLGFFTLAMLAVAVMALVWSRLGVAGLFLTGGLGLIVTLLAYWRLRARLKRWPFLSGTLSELRKDLECLKHTP